jgi:hypothetical protein
MASTLGWVSIAAMSAPRSGTSIMTATFAESSG